MEPNAIEGPEAAQVARRMHTVESTWSPYDRISAESRGRLKRLWQRLGFSDEFGTLARYEVDMALLRVRCALSGRHRRAIRALQARREIQLHLGCGNNAMPGWVNLDCYPPAVPAGVEIIVLDMRRGLPCADASAVAVYSEHFLEHVPLDTVRRVLLPECFRVLAPGGAIRIGVPDGEHYVRHYVSSHTAAPDTDHRETGGMLPMMWINHVARSSQHKYLYDFETLAYLLGEAGFVELRRGHANDSTVSSFRGIDLTAEGRAEETVYIEGRRP
jgi:predicted SAM-dependent methyltransferase